jgi:hypothetical protein
MIDDRRMEGEDTLDTLSKAELADCDGPAETGVILGNDGPLKSLQALFVALLDLDVHADGVSRTKFRDIRALILSNHLGQQRIYHGSTSSSNPLLPGVEPPASKSGLKRAVFSSAAFRRHFRISS